jgi:heavy metal translocating P-type ATPase
MSRMAVDKDGNSMDVRISFPQRGLIDIEHPMFRDDGDACRRFVQAIFSVELISSVRLTAHGKGRATLYYDARKANPSDILQQLGRRLKVASAEAAGCVSAPPNTRVVCRATAPQRLSRDRRGIAHLQRHGLLISGWRLVHSRVGRTSFRHAAIFRRAALGREIERELTCVLGVERCVANSLLGTVTIDHDPRELSRTRLVELLDQALVAATIPSQLDRIDASLAVCTASVPLAIAASTTAPVLLPFSAAVLLSTSMPFLAGSCRTLVREKRLGCEALDTLVVVGCIATMQLVPGAVLCWCLAAGRSLVKRTENRSKSMLRSIAGKQPQSVWLVKQGVEIRVALDRLEPGDVIVVNTGEVVPVDGIVAEGLATVDQHMLTGESTPTEKGPGDRVFAATVVVGGKLFVAVEARGADTAAARIGKILQNTAGHRLSRQQTGERLADKAAAPMIALGAVGYATLGPAAAVAVVNADLGTGIRLAAPVAMLSSIALCASKGILVKDGQALERFGQIDTIVFDKTGTLTHERPDVGTIHPCGTWQADDILRFAAAAEQKFHHPIALAIRHAAHVRGLTLPSTAATELRVGLGITVNVEGRLVHVGSCRFLESEGIVVDRSTKTSLDRAHARGMSSVLVAIDHHMAGVIELEAAVRPEVKAVVAGLRARGVKHLAILSGDHEAPTRRLAEELGMDIAVAEVMPEQKAAHIERMQREGKKVCFIGDGINDAIALKRADVSISLRGAASIATDTAQILFLDDGLARLCDLRDIATNLDRNVRRSWRMLVVPNALCVAGVFTLGWGVMASVVLNNVSALAALANGLVPMRKAMANEQARAAVQRLHTSNTAGRRLPAPLSASGLPASQRSPLRAKAPIEHNQQTSSALITEPLS